MNEISRLLVKPISRPELLDAVRSVLQGPIVTAALDAAAPPPTASPAGQTAL
jgi:hypothetical protein